MSIIQCSLRKVKKNMSIISRKWKGRLLKGIKRLEAILRDFIESIGKEYLRIFKNPVT